MNNINIEVDLDHESVIHFYMGETFYLLHICQHRFVNRGTWYVTISNSFIQKCFTSKNLNVAIGELIDYLEL